MGSLITVHGHRGARWDYPENTLFGFDHAIKLGVDAIELDVVVTRDNQLIVVHDPYINRKIISSGWTPPYIPYRFLSLAQVRKFHCGEKKNADFPNQVALPDAKIPTLGEIFELVKKYERPVLINFEAKIFEEHPLAAPSAQKFAQLSFELIQKHEIKDKIIFQSFDQRILGEMKKIDPTVLTSFLTKKEGDDLEEICKRLNTDYASPRFDLLTKEKVENLKKRGLKVVPWTVNKKSDWEQMIEMGVSGIISDDPKGLIEFLSLKGHS